MPPADRTATEVELKGVGRQARGRNGWFVPARACVSASGEETVLTVASVRAHGDLPPILIRLPREDATALHAAIGRHIGSDGGGRVHFVYTAAPDSTDRQVALALQDRVRGIAQRMGLASARDKTPGAGDIPYVDLIVSVPDARIREYVEATRDCPPTSDVLCEGDLQALALESLGFATELCLTGDCEPWERQPAQPQAAT